MAISSYTGLLRRVAPRNDNLLIAFVLDSKAQADSFRSFEIEDWNLFGIWDLLFGICDHELHGFPALLS
jgi:hypothetical protein